MKILVSLSYSKTLPVGVIDALCKERKFWRDLRPRLQLLPLLPKGKNDGDMPSATPHENAVAYSKQHELPLYMGYIIYRNNADDNWKIEDHSFCIEDGRVVEPTTGYPWFDVYYVGFRVPRDDIPGMRYLNYFMRMDYLRQCLGMEPEPRLPRKGVKVRA